MATDFGDFINMARSRARSSGGLSPSQRATNGQNFMRNANPFNTKNAANFLNSTARNSRLTPSQRGADIRNSQRNFAGSSSNGGNRGSYNPQQEEKRWDSLEEWQKPKAIGDARRDIEEQHSNSPFIHGLMNAVDEFTPKNQYQLARRLNPPFRYYAQAANPGVDLPLNSSFLPGPDKVYSRDDDVSLFLDVPHEFDGPGGMMRMKEEYWNPVHSRRIDRDTRPLPNSRVEMQQLWQDAFDRHSDDIPYYAGNIKNPYMSPKEEAEYADKYGSMTFNPLLTDNNEWNTTVDPYYRLLVENSGLPGYEKDALRDVMSLEQMLPIFRSGFDANNATLVPQVQNDLFRLAQGIHNSRADAIDALIDNGIISEWKYGESPHAIGSDWGTPVIPKALEGREPVYPYGYGWSDVQLG